MNLLKNLFAISLVSLAAQTALANEAGAYSGPFLGVNAGYGNSDLTLTARDVPRLPTGWSYPDFGGLNTIAFDDQLTGAVGGIDAGYNWTAGDWVYGGAVSYSMLNASHQDWTKADDKRQPIPPGGIVSGQDDIFSSDLQSLALLSVRFGKNIDKLLIYGRAGLAVGDYHLAALDNNVAKNGSNTGNNTGGGSDKVWLTGYSVGVGGEYLLNESWSAGLEYNYVQLSSSNINPGGTGCYNTGAGTLPCSGVTGPVTYDLRPEIDLRLAAFHVNYRF